MDPEFASDVALTRDAPLAAAFATLGITSRLALLSWHSSFMAGDGDVLTGGLSVLYTKLCLLTESGGGGYTSALDATECARNLRMVVYMARMKWMEEGGQQCSWSCSCPCCG